jgi:phage gp36-like protein
VAEYVTLAELKDLGLNPDSFVETLAPRRHEAIEARSDYIDGFLRAKFTLPLVIVSNDIKRCCAILASIDLIRNRGVSPEEGDQLKGEEDRQDKWLALIAKGLVVPQVTDSSSGAAPGIHAGGGRVVSSSSRGFSVRGTTNPRGPFQGD